jgi:diaminohydroxyphosphoribosylaminopyrimidine deaminase/5-amino-6-(5-phosphoribosylamino)uracil reductase
MTPAYSEAMRRAVAEARKWMGATSPNPCVGAAALDADGNILAVAAHRKAGGPHAEAALIAACRYSGILASVQTLCVTLEPCNHTGRTPPCAEAIIKAGIRRVVVGTKDPNPEVRGGGIAALRAAGVEVIEGVEENLCRQILYSFAFSVTQKRPWITVKRAFDSNDSMIPPRGKKSFTSPSSLRLAHRLRKGADAIMTGSGTILADNPLFTVRHVADFGGKKRLLVIMDRRRRVSSDYLRRAEGNGFHPVLCDGIDQALELFSAHSVRNLLVEAGPLLSTTILEKGLWNLQIDIRRQSDDTPDLVIPSLNQATVLPFDASDWDLENLLPYESEEACL